MMLAMVGGLLFDNKLFISVIAKGIVSECVDFAVDNDFCETHANEKCFEANTKNAKVSYRN
jgi:hypothetical protein